MNKQQPGIEWTHVYGKGTGYTWNVVQGCKHDCEWQMPDGTIAQCYAKAVADKFRSPKFMKDGFDQHYWNPERLNEPLKLTKPAGIFLDSFSDLMGHWVPDEQIEQVLDICKQAHWHTFQLLTKNAKRLKNFKFPDNVWVGVSAPPSFMFGKRLTTHQQSEMLTTMLTEVEKVDVPVRWMSIEPLSFDIAPYLSSRLQWAVIGAATNGNKAYQPEPKWVRNALSELDATNTKVFFKGNLKWPITEWREEFPMIQPSQFAGRLF